MAIKQIGGKIPLNVTADEHKWGPWAPGRPPLKDVGRSSPARVCLWQTAQIDSQGICQLKECWHNSAKEREKKMECVWAEGWGGVLTGLGYVCGSVSQSLVEEDEATGYHINRNLFAC